MHLFSTLVPEQVILQIIAERKEPATLSDANESYPKGRVLVLTAALLAKFLPFGHLTGLNVEAEVMPARATKRAESLKTIVD